MGRQREQEKSTHTINIQFWEVPKFVSSTKKAYLLGLFHLRKKKFIKWLKKLFIYRKKKKFLRTICPYDDQIRIQKKNSLIRLFKALEKKSKQLLHNLHACLIWKQSLINSISSQKKSLITFPQVEKKITVLIQKINDQLKSPFREIKKNNVKPNPSYTFDHKPKKKMWKSILWSNNISKFYTQKFWHTKKEHYTIF